jgi:HD-like signal output (HDOD) protein/CheY-like chemotaxis protein
MIADTAATPASRNDSAAGGRPAVLFVDDEPAVLAALRGTLRRLRQTYEFHFAPGADDALALMAHEPIDVVITDIRMPGTNGVELLRQIKADYPHVIRYVLSGEAEQELVVRAVPVAHRWLTKPCDRDALTDALAEAVRFQTLLSDPEIRAAVSDADALPTPPAVYGELCELLDDSEVSIAVIADLVSCDAAISAKLLQWSNSAFSGGHRCDDVHDAIVRVGLSALSQLVLLAGVFRSLDPPDAIPGWHAELLREHLGLVSALSVDLAHPSNASTARLGGLFSEIGLLLEAAYLPDRLAETFELAMSTDSTLHEAERRRFGVTYPELGGHLLSVWGLPADLVLAAAGSHRLPPSCRSVPLRAGEAVQAARLVAQRFPHAKRMAAPHLDRLDDELGAAVDRWRSAIASSGGPLS